jgi:small subunit ribosomal protein S13
MNIYILGKYIPGNKSVEMALQSIKGIGKYNALTICRQLGYQKKFKLKDLSQTQIIKLSEFINKNFLTETSLQDKKFEYINKHRENKSYRGWRHLLNLPVRGQRTHSNASTRKKKKIV